MTVISVRRVEQEPVASQGPPKPPATLRGGLGSHLPGLAAWEDTVCPPTQALLQEQGPLLMSRARDPSLGGRTYRHWTQAPGVTSVRPFSTLPEPQGLSRCPPDAAHLTPVSLSTRSPPGPPQHRSAPPPAADPAGAAPAPVC